MKPSHSVRVILAALATATLASSASAQETSPPLTTAELEASYVAAIAQRTTDILALLKLEDAAKSNRVAEIILAQYRLLRLRDDTIDTMIKLMAADEALAQRSRAEVSQTMTPRLHERFLARLAGELTPDQLETVKDKMTYGKVKVTFDAYCQIVPALTDSDKAKIMELLKLAREEAIDGGSTAEKSRVFQKYKDQINAWLDAHGHDVAKAYRDWEAKQPKPEERAPAAK